MSQEQEYSDEFINAFFDNEISPAEKSRLAAGLTCDEVFNRRIGELRRIRELIRIAYNELPRVDRTMRAGKAVVASAP